MTLELEPLAKLSREPLSLTGRVELAALQVRLEPLALSGHAKLAGVRLGLEHGSVSLEGALRAEGTRIHATDLHLLVGGESATLSGSYDLATGVAQLRGSVSGAPSKTACTNVGSPIEQSCVPVSM